MTILPVLLQLVGITLVILYFTVESFASMAVLIVGIVLAIAGYVGRSMTKARLHMAARRGNVTEIQHWLAKGFEINSKRENGFTPLHWTAFKGHFDATRFLIDSGAEVNSRDVAGMTPLKHAQNQSHTDVVEILKQHGGIES